MKKLKGTMFGQETDETVEEAIERQEKAAQRSMRGKAARRKGTDYERKIARTLKKLTGKRWSRVPMSGASYIPGDVTCLDFDLPFVIELKNREDIRLNKIYKSPHVLNHLVSMEQILIFNNDGQDLVVIPYELGAGKIEIPYSVLDSCGMECYVITLKNFATILKEIMA